MNKVICDICGTMYPETNSKCPICGGTRRPEDKTVQVEDPQPEQAGTKDKKNYSSGKTKFHGGGSNKGLIITIVVLLIAIALVSLYIAHRFFGLFPTESLRLPFGKNDPTQPSTSEQATDPTVPCIALSLDHNVLEFNAAGTAQLLEAKIEPADTTDPVKYVSSDPAVATVTDQGRVTAVAPGQAVIEVICGDRKQQCRVICDFDEQATDATEPSGDTTPQDTMELNRSDISFFAVGESFRFDVEGLSPAQITWTTDNANIASIENGRVTAVGPGVTTIHGEYEGKVGSCIVRCQFGQDNDSDNEPDATDAPSGSGIHISHEDVTIAEDESFNLRLLDQNGNALDASWSVSDSSVCDVSGSQVTGTGKGMATVSTTYDGKTYSCIVRIN